MSKSAMLDFFEFPVEIRFMIYRLLFRPSRGPILLSLFLFCSTKRSSQLLRVCRACHEEGSPVLYGDNIFALDWAYRGTEFGILEFFETIGLKNRQLIRHLSVREASVLTLKQVGERRSLRPMLENLESLSLEIYKDGRFSSLIVNLLRDISRWLKRQRGPYHRLVTAFKTPAKHALCHEFCNCSLSIRLISAAMRPGPEDIEFDVEAEIEAYVLQS